MQDLSLLALGWVGGSLELLAVIILGLSAWQARRATRQNMQAQEWIAQAHPSHAPVPPA